MRIATEDVPAHLDIAVGRDFERRRRRRLPERKAKRPAAEDVPVGNAGPRLEADQLLLGLRRNSDLLDAHFFCPWSVVIRPLLGRRHRRARRP